MVNGVRFVVYSRDTRRTTQNSGVSTVGPDGTKYYGLLEDILELNYINECKVVLFRCKWFKTDNQRCITNNNITRIATNIEWFKDEQYILATQVSQVFYLQDPSKGQHWKVVQEVNHRKIWDRDIIVEDNDEDVIHDNNSNDLALSANLDDLNYMSLSIGEPTEVRDPQVENIHIVAHDDADFIHDSDSDASNSDASNSDDSNNEIVTYIYSSDESD